MARSWSESLVSISGLKANRYALPALENFKIHSLPPLAAVGGSIQLPNDYSPELDESLVNEQGHEIPRQVVSFARQQQDPIKSFRPELDVNLWMRRWGETGKMGN